jgi:signal transduction histidine kinase
MDLRFASRWSGWSLSRQFALAGGLVMLFSMLAVGRWVTSRIETNVVQNTVSSTALFMDSFIAPLAQELENTDTLSIGPIRALGERVVDIRIWKPGGLVAYAVDFSLVGKTFPPTPKLEAAFMGKVTGGFADAHDGHQTPVANGPLLEIYAPIRKDWAGDVIAVAEFYEKAGPLEAALARVRLQTWAGIAAVTVLVGGLLFGIVDRGSRMIGHQRKALADRIRQLQEMSEENRQLRYRAQRASSRVSEVSEQLLRRLSADLHDGPAQLVGLAALRLDSLKGIGGKKERDREIDELENTLGEVVHDIRNICQGLSLPELANMPLTRVAEHAIAVHERRTGMRVGRQIDIGRNDVSEPLKICLYRFIQEGLNNAHRHAAGAEMRVTVSETGSFLVARIDNGPGGQANETSVHGGLGLRGLRNRIESLGGTLDFSVRLGEGAVLAMEIDMESGIFDE